MLESLSPFSRGRDRSKEIPQPSIKERAQITEFVAGIPPTRDLLKILHWIEDPETRKHLDPLPYFPNWEDPDDVESATNELRDYYRNIDKDSHRYEPNNIQPIRAVNSAGEAIGILTLRWRGDKFIPRTSRVASIERLVVEPDLQHVGIGKQLVTKALDYAFEEYDGYNGQSAEEVRAWIMTDRQAGEFHKNINFIQELGFKFLRGESGLWSRYAEKIGYETNREAYQYKIEKEAWEARKLAAAASLETKTA